MEIEIEDLMKEYTTYLLKLSYLYVGDRQIAEDIVQDVFLKLYRKFGTQIIADSPKSYIVRMTINQSKDYLKSWHAKKIKAMEMLGFDKSFHERNTLIEQEENVEIGLAVMKLPVKYRELIILYYFDEQSIPSISNMLHLPQGTVKTRLIKARRILKEMLQTDRWEVLLR